MKTTRQSPRAQKAVNYYPTGQPVTKGNPILRGIIYIARVGSKEIKVRLKHKLSISDQGSGSGINAAAVVLRKDVEGKRDTPDT